MMRCWKRNDSTADTSYHVKGDIALDGYPPSPLDLWVAGGDGAALAAGRGHADGRELYEALFERNAAGSGARRSI